MLQDFLQSGFLETSASISLFDMVIVLILSFAIGLLIFFVYSQCYTGVMYPTTFGVTLVSLTMITSMLIMAVTSNIVLSLGMVGALSIVRFRAAIKDPMDIAFLFWAIASGIVLAAGFLPLAVIGSLCIGIVLLLFSNPKKAYKPYILVLHCDNPDIEKEAHEYISKQVKKLSLKSKQVTASCIELNYELRLKDEQTDFIHTLSSMQGVANVVLVSYNGDFMG